MDALELTIQEAAQALGRHPKTVRRYIKQGKLHWTKVQGKFGPEYRVTQQSVAQLSSPPPSPPQFLLDTDTLKANTEAIRELSEKMETFVRGLLPAAQGYEGIQERLEWVEQQLSDEQAARQQLEEELAQKRSGGLLGRILFWRLRGEQPSG